MANDPPPPYDPITGTTTLRDEILGLAIVPETEHAKGYNAGLEAAVAIVDAYNARRIDALMLAWRGRRANGKKTGGPVPYGYRVDKDGETLIEVKSEQRVIVTARALRAQGMSLRAIAKTLADRKLRSRNGKRFDPQQISRMTAVKGAIAA